MFKYIIAAIIINIVSTSLSVYANDTLGIQFLLSGEEKLSYKDCDGCHDGIYRERFDYYKNPECFECHNPEHPVSGTNSIKNIASKSIKISEHNIHVTYDKDNYVNDPVPMVFVSAGAFIMGENDRIQDEAPEHIVYTKSFWIDKFEVTNERYKKFIEDTSNSIPAYWVDGTYPKNKHNHPVVLVNWYDANNYCKWAGKRLPAEAEWEKAARGTDGRDFPWGDDLDPEKANLPLSEIGDTTPIGKYEDGKSPYGIYDMAGNVYEWVQEWYYLYPGSPAKDFNKFSGRKNKILKGGSWYNCLTYACGFSIYTYNRAFLSPVITNNSTGIRCAVSGNNK